MYSKTSVYVFDSFLGFSLVTVREFASLYSERLKKLNTYFITFINMV